MNERFEPTDLVPEERDLDHLLSVTPPQALPFGFRDRVMGRLQERQVAWEWIVAALFATPSLVFLAHQLLVHSEDFTQAIANVVTAASSQTSDAFFFVDGLTVLALALLGIACAFAAHALLAQARGTASRSVVR